MISPTTLQNLNPWPEKPAARRRSEAGQGVDDEVLVGRVGEHAGPQSHRRPVRVGEVAGDGLTQYSLVLIPAVPV